MKYVLYDGKAYEVKQNGILPCKSIEHYQDTAIEISEAEYHARKLLEGGTTNSLNLMAARDAAINFIRECEAERTPKPEVTEAHIGCLVEMNVSDPEDFYLAEMQEEYMNNQDVGIRLPRQPVPLAFHKHDERVRPDWVDSNDWVLFFKPGIIGQDMTKAENAPWDVIAYFAVIKPILGE